MSFDIFLQYAQRETPPHADLGSAVAGVVRAFGGRSSDEFGYFFDLPDGCSVELFIKRDDDSAMLALRAVTLDVVRFIRELMQATGWAALVSGNELAALTLKSIAAEDVHEGFPALTVISTDADILAFLAPSFGSWAEYRDQVTG